MPSFEMREGPESTKTLDTPAAPAGVSAAEPRKSGAAPTILVGRFDCETDQTFDTLSRGFTRHMIAGLTRFQDLIVLGPDTSSAYASASQQERSEIIKTVDMIVTGSMAIDAERFCVEAMLIDANTDRVIWAETFDRKLQPSSLVAVRDDVANCIARTLAHSYGVILSNRANEFEGAAAEEPCRPGVRAKS